MTPQRRQRRCPIHSVKTAPIVPVWWCTEVCTPVLAEACRSGGFRVEVTFARMLPCRSLPEMAKSKRIVGARC